MLKAVFFCCCCFVLFCFFAVVECSLLYLVISSFLVLSFLSNFDLYALGGAGIGASQAVLVLKNLPAMQET